MTETNEESAISSIRNPELIRIHLKNLIKEVAEGISAEDFQNIIGTLQYKTSAARKLYLMQQSAILNDIHQTIDYMCTQSGIDIKYNDITKLISTNVNIKTQSWRPSTGDCEMQLYPYRKQLLEEKKQKLEKLVQEERRLRLLMKSALDKKRSFFNEQHIQLLSTKTKLNLYYDQCINS